MKICVKPLVKNAAIVAGAGLIVKLLGAAYRFMLTSRLGAEGIGLYQMVFPFYVILLTLSSTGIPTAIARLKAAGGGKLLKRSIMLFSSIGLLGSLIMFFGAETISSLQGNRAAAGAYRTLSPSVFSVSGLSCYRGVYQGELNFKPTAITQIIEQAVKFAVGLSLCSFFGTTNEQKAALAALAVTVSEFVALAVVASMKRKKEEGSFVSAKKLLATALPITVSSVALPLAKAFDSFTVMRFLGGGESAVTALYGLYSGVCESVIAVPVAVCYALAVSGLPLVAKGEKADDLVLYTLIASSALAVATYLAAPTIVATLYPNLTKEHAAVAVTLIKISAPNVVGLSLAQSLAAKFIGEGKLRVPPLCFFIGVAFKAAACLLIFGVGKTGVYGYAFSDIICYFVATACFLLYSIREEVTKGAMSDGEERINNNRSGRKGERPLVRRA